MRTILEKLILLAILAGVTFSYAFQQGLPAFQGEFNSVDGSLHVVRTLHLLIACSILLAVSFYAVPTYLSHGKLWRFSLIVVSVFLLAVGVEWALQLLTKVLFNLPIAADQISDKRLMFVEHRTLTANLFRDSAILTAVALVYGILRDWVIRFQTTQQMEREQSRAELDYLRSQINPHFLFNTLNTIYAMTQKSGDVDAQKAVLLLSDSMRYMLYDSAAEQVELGVELDQINHYLDLVRLRFEQDAPLDITVTSTIEDETLTIAPLLLMPFVENAIKHGLGKGGQGRIRVELSVEKRYIRFTVENTIPTDKTAYREQFGIGIKNVRKRLELLYPKRHRLQIRQEDGWYRVSLQITGEE